MKNTASFHHSFSTTGTAEIAVHQLASMDRLEVSVCSLCGAMVDGDFWHYHANWHQKRGDGIPSPIEDHEVHTGRPCDN